MEKPKLVAAVSAAVTAYIRAEEEERLAALAARPAPPPAVSLWGHSARQETMQMRRLLQMRLGRR